MTKNEFVDEAKRALSEGRKVILLPYPPGIGPTIAVARERDEQSRQANREGCRMQIFNAAGSVVHESAIDHAAARELLARNAEYDGPDHLRPGGR
ncbi:MAG: hypothetical protein K8H88_00375 [Sandaracinaceae bacterium]|nr:hypothetical protein [Sandaracinaceae bacterium]